jgi:spore coat protein U-like protein
MRRPGRTIALALLLCAFCISASAAISCTISSSGFATAYVPSTAATNVTQGTVTVTCQRNVAGDGTTANFTLAADNGLHASGQQNRAQLGATASRINYDLFQDSTCATVWRANAPNRISGSITGLAGFIPSSTNIPFWGCVAGSQTGLPAGTYADTVTVTLRGAGTITATFPVSIFTPASCSITTAPGNVNFTSTAFGGVQNANTPFSVTCTNLLPYTMALDATVGVVGGLQYGVTLSASGATGTGLAQNFTVDGTMPANQAGTCAASSCVSTQARTLTISY